MRVWIILALVAGLLCGSGMTPVRAAPKLDLSVGFGGYYRPQTLVPVTVAIDNADGAAINGELRLLSEDFPDRMDRYRFPVSIPRGASQQRILNFVPSGFAHEISVELWSERRKLASGKSTRCQEVYGQDRLLVIVGGTGSTLSYVNGQNITAPQDPFPRPWDLSRIEAWRQGGYGYGGRPMTMPTPGSGPTGKVNLIHTSPQSLPDNPEAYGSADVLLLSADVTENALSAEAQKAIAIWVANGGHLLVAGGGVGARFDAPFFAGLLPMRKGVTLPGAEMVANPAIGKGWTKPLGSGRVTLLDFDPDTVRVRDSVQAAKFFGKLVERNPLQPITSGIGSELQAAVSVSKLKPPNLTLIVLYLIVYLILLVPVNYFVLRRLDQRELAWLTTPAIVLVFTFGAYGIGYATKGNRLVFNVAGIMETAAGQQNGEVVSSLLLFSPVRTTYKLELGRDALLVRGYDVSEEQYYRRGYREPTARQQLTIVQDGDRLTVDRVSVSQWDFRRFVAAYRVNLGGGFSAGVTPGAAGASPRATGTVTNNTPFTFKSCMLYQDGALVAEFAMSRGQTVDVAKAGSGSFKPVFSEDEQSVYDSLKNAITPQAVRGGRLATGSVLVGFTTDSLAPAQLDRRAVRTELNAVVVHL
jgi:hypothetical protein